LEHKSTPPNSAVVPTRDLRRSNPLPTTQIQQIQQSSAQSSPHLADDEQHQKNRGDTVEVEQLNGLLYGEDWLERIKEAHLLDNIPPHILVILESVSKKPMEEKVAYGTKLSQLTDQLKTLEIVSKSNEDKVGELTVNLQKEHDITTSLKESIAEYEKKLNELEARMWDNLNKEGTRRQEAEFQARRLKKKVEELQFLLDELKDESSADEKDDISDDDEES